MTIGSKFVSFILIMVFTDQKNEVLELMFFNPHQFEQTQKYYILYKDFAYLEVI